MFGIISVIVTIIMFAQSSNYSALSALDDLCGETIKTEVKSPSGRYVATIFERDCGATTDFATIVSLRKAEEVFDAKGAKGQQPVLIVSGQPAVTLSWSSDTDLVVTLPPTEAFTKRESWRDVRIVYQQDYLR